MLEAFRMTHELGVSLFKVILASCSFYYIFEDERFLQQDILFIDWKNIRFIFYVFVLIFQYYEENMGLDIFLCIYYI